jgi:hypothetical protein
LAIATTWSAVATATVTAPASTTVPVFTFSFFGWWGVIAAGFITCGHTIWPCFSGAAFAASVATWLFLFLLLAALIVWKFDYTGQVASVVLWFVVHGAGVGHYH